MQNYYGVPATPDVYFDGMNNVVGGGQNMYPIYEPQYLLDKAELSKLIMDAHVFFPSAGQGSVTVNIEVAPGEVISSAHTVKIIIFEDDIPLGANLWHKIGRSIAHTTPLTALNGGQTQTVTDSFPIDPFSQNWNEANCHAIAYVQRDSNKKIIQSTLATFSYDVEVTDLEAVVTTVPTGQTDEIDVQVEYTGAVADDVILALDKSALPPGWDAELVWNAGTYPAGLTIPMGPGQIDPYQVRIIPGANPGAGSVRVSVEPDTDPLRHVERTYYMFAGTPSILFVDDDRGATTENAYEQAILDAGYFAITHTETVDGVPTAAEIAAFDAVIWTTGELQTGTLGNLAETILGLYLDAGGKLFFSSQGFLNQRGANAFAQTYLGVSSFAQDVQAPSCTGVASDPIGDGLSLSMSPPFPDFADGITGQASGSVAWLNGTSNPVGLRLDSGVFKSVFMSAAFDGISTSAQDPNNQATVMERILDWLLPTTATDVQPTLGQSSAAFALAQNTPNPFRGTTSVRFAVPKEGPVTLAVYNVAGRKVADLVSGSLGAGAHAVSWDGTDRDGGRVASGVYLYRLTAGGESVAKEMIFVR
jgi:hypothetical protein